MPTFDDDADNDDEIETHNETQTERLVHTSLVARIEYLESVNATLKGKDKKKHFSIEDIKDDDKMVCFYTGFKSYMIFNAFFEFLGPAVDKLNYWGCKEGVRKIHYYLGMFLISPHERN